MSDRDDRADAAGGADGTDEAGGVDRADGDDRAGETIEFDKLVRDRIPDLIRESGDRPETHVADDSEYRRRLRAKLVEEATEFRESGDAEELADVLAVVGTLCRVEGIDREEVERLGREKTQERGGFEERIVLERVRK